MTNHSSDSMISSITKELNVWGRKQEKDAILGWERLTVQMLKCCRDISDPFFLCPTTWKHSLHVLPDGSHSNIISNIKSRKKTPKTKE